MKDSILISRVVTFVGVLRDVRVRGICTVQPFYYHHLSGDTARQKYECFIVSLTDLLKRGRMKTDDDRLYVQNILQSTNKHSTHDFVFRRYQFDRKASAGYGSNIVHHYPHRPINIFPTALDSDKVWKSRRKNVSLIE